MAAQRGGAGGEAAIDITELDGRHPPDTPTFRSLSPGLGPGLIFVRLGNDRAASETVDRPSITPHRHHTVTLQPSNVAEGRLARQETYTSD